jgi:hypothetical protein
MTFSTDVEPPVFTVPLKLDSVGGATVGAPAGASELPGLDPQPTINTRAVTSASPTYASFLIVFITLSFLSFIAFRHCEKSVLCFYVRHCEEP